MRASKGAVAGRNHRRRQGSLLIAVGHGHASVQPCCARGGLSLPLSPQARLVAEPSVRCVRPSPPVRQEERMADPVEALVVDLLEWIGREPRPYTEVIETWRTSCPRLPVWEEANARGLLEHLHTPGS